MDGGERQGRFGYLHFLEIIPSSGLPPTTMVPPHLPLEIIIEVLQVASLCREDIRSCSRVSPDWRIVAQQQLMRAPRPSGNVELQRMLKFMKQREYERIPTEIVFSPRHRSKPLFAEFLALAPRIEIVTLDATSPRAEYIDLSFLHSELSLSLPFLLEKPLTNRNDLTGLTTLNLIRIEQDPGHRTSFPLDLPFLRTLRLADLRLPSSFDRWKLPELRQLDICDCRIPDGARLPLIPKLSFLRIAKSIFPDLVLPSSPAISFPSLRRLVLEDCWVSGFDDLERFLPLIVPTLESLFLGLNLFQSNFNPPEPVASNMLYDRFSLCPHLSFLALPTDLLLPLEERPLPFTLKHLQLLPRKFTTSSSPAPPRQPGTRSKREIVQSIVLGLEGLRTVTIPSSSAVPHPALVECCKEHQVELVVDLLES